MKILFIISITILSLNDLFAAKGVVTVLEAPIFRHPNENSKIVQYVRKGTVIYIHDSDIYSDKHLENLKFETISMDDVEVDQTDLNQREQLELMAQKESLYNIDDYEYKDKLNYNDETLLKFIRTIDKLGRTGYIPIHYIKILYNNKKELDDTFKLKYDPTDYRLAEPLPKNYPLYPGTENRAALSLSFGQSSTIYYPYISNIKESETSVRYGFSGIMERSISIDLSNRTLFGGTLNVYTQKNNFSLINNYTAQEVSMDIGLGPSISYDVFRGVDYSINIWLTILANYSRVYITMTNSSGKHEERLYKGLNFSPQAGMSINKRNLIKNFLDGFIGIQFQADLKHELRTSTPTAFPDLWNDKLDEVNRPFNGHVSFLIGLKTTI